MSGYERCGATNRAGNPCGRPAGWGTDHPRFGRCKLHGGNTPNGRQHGHREAARTAVETYGIGAEGTRDPIDALLQILSRSTAAAVFIQEQIAALEPDQLIRGTRSVRRTVVAGGGANGADAVTTVTEAGSFITPWLDLLHREEDRASRVSAVLLQHGVNELALQIQRQAATDLVAVIRGILDDLALTAEQRALVPDVVPRHLRAVDTG